MLTLDDFHNVHDGSTIWVFGSGATLEFLDPQFFDDKLCVSTNLVTEHFPLKSFYLFSHYHPAVKRILDDDGLVTAFTHDMCSTRWSGTQFY